MFLKIYGFIREYILITITLVRKFTIGLIRDQNFFRKSPYELYQEDSLNKSYQYFKDFFSKSIFLQDNLIRKFSIIRANENDIENNKLYLEFGVLKGESINSFSKIFPNKIFYAFDSFEGFKEDWLGTQATKGTFNLDGNIPKLNKNINPIKGWIQDTLPSFLEENKNKKIIFTHIDVDTYIATNFILKNIKPYLVKGSIILFDELYNCPGWEENEFKALIENFNKDNYKYLAFSKNGARVAIEIL